MEDTVKACPAVMAKEHCGLLILEHGGHGQGLSGSYAIVHCGLLILEHGGHGQGLQVATTAMLDPKHGWRL